MDLATILVSIGLSVPVSLAAAAWLSRAVIQHKLSEALEKRKAELARELEDHKGALAAELAREKAEIEGQIRKAVESELGDAAAQRQYEFEARKRLYTAIGPLRFQLIMACRDFAARITNFERQRHRTLRADGGYYALSTLYRLVRPLAIAELIERQVAYSDFAVDKGAVDCLRFKRSARRILSNHEIVCDYPAVDWSRQVEHAFADSISIAANVLIVPGSDGRDRVQRFDEFANIAEDERLDRLAPFPQLLADFSVRSKPLLWVRLVAYGNACAAFANQGGKGLGFERIDYPLAKLLAASEAPYMLEHQETFEKAARELALASP